MTDSPNKDERSTSGIELPSTGGFKIEDNEFLDRAPEQQLDDAIASLREAALADNVAAGLRLSYVLAMVRRITSEASGPIARQAALDQADAALQESHELNPGGLTLAIAEAHKRSQAGYAERHEQREAFMRRLTVADAAAEPVHDFLTDALQMLAERHAKVTGEQHLDIFGTDSRVQLRKRAGEVRIANHPAFIEALADDPDLRAEWAEQVWSLTETTAKIKKALTVEFAANDGEVDKLRPGTEWTGPSTSATIKHGAS